MSQEFEFFSDECEIEEFLYFIENYYPPSVSSSSHLQVVNPPPNSKLSYYNLLKSVFQKYPPSTAIRLKDLVKMLNEIAPESKLKNASIRHTLTTEPCFINLGTKIGWKYDEGKDKQGKSNSKLRRKY